MFQKAKKAHRWVILTLLLMLGCAQPWEREPGPFDRNDLPLNIYNLRGNVWVAEDYNYYRTNLSMYIDHDAGVVFIGAGWSYKSARQLLWKAAANSYGPFQALIVPGYRLSYTGGLPPFQRHELKVIMQQNAPVLLRLHWDHMQQEMLQSFGSWRELSRLRQTYCIKIISP
ncbi:MAG: hypothetical protein KDK27_01260 [Leptospiraceae bacterium]|nr:hypothetical protein [Leptospiraceae bacterium]